MAATKLSATEVKATALSPTGIQRPSLLSLQPPQNPDRNTTLVQPYRAPHPASEVEDGHH